VIITSIFIYDITDDKLDELYVSEIRFSELAVTAIDAIRDKQALKNVNQVVRIHEKSDWIYAQRASSTQIILYTASFSLNEAAMYACFAQIKFNLLSKNGFFLDELEHQLAYLSQDELQHQEKIKAIEAELALTVKQLQIDADQLVERGEKLEVLLQRTEVLNQTTISFTTKAFKQPRKSPLIDTSFFQKLFCLGDSTDNEDETVPFLGSNPSQ
jgi:hypothetical protein